MQAGRCFRPPRAGVPAQARCAWPPAQALPLEKNTSPEGPHGIGSVEANSPGHVWDLRSHRTRVKFSPGAEARCAQTARSKSSKIELEVARGPL